MCLQLVGPCQQTSLLCPLASIGAATTPSSIKRNGFFARELILIIKMLIKTSYYDKGQNVKVILLYFVFPLSLSSIYIWVIMDGLLATKKVVSDRTDASSMLYLLNPTSSDALFQYSCYIEMIYFIRHAKSHFNAAIEALKQQHGTSFKTHPEHFHTKFDQKYLDVQINEEGRKQAQGAREKMKDINIDLVIVSPMRRALQTCSIIFQGHQSRPQFIVQPNFREVMESATDLTSLKQLTESMQLYQSFNFSGLPEKEAWFVHTLQSQKDRQVILSQLEGLQGQERNQKAIECCLSLEKQNWSKRLSSPASEELIKERMMPNYNQQLKVLKHFSARYKSIAVVSHSECLKRYAGGEKVQNCQIISKEASKVIEEISG